MTILCPYCDSKSKCILSRTFPKVNVVTRRHECIKCHRKFSTLEFIPGFMNLTWFTRRVKRQTKINHEGQNKKKPQANPWMTQP